MSCHWYDNAETAVFTPRDYQVELLAAAFERNTIVCLGHKSSKEFIALKLLQEFGRKCEAVSKINLYLTTSGAPSMYTMIEHLTDFEVFQQEDMTTNIDTIPTGYHVYMLHPDSCLAALRAENLNLKNVHLMILEDCHAADVHRTVLSIFKEFYVKLECDRPRVLGLAGPLHSASCPLEELSAMLCTLEDNIQCKTETASDIVTVLRYCSKPIERIIQCAPFEKDELTSVLENIICTRKAFLNNHRYDPFEIYNSVDFIDELKDIPDPKKEPLEILDTLLCVLHEMGPWAASRMAFNMHNRIEKQKIKTPHERHYILLCLVNTALFELHTIGEEVFNKVQDRKTIIKMYSSPKMLRLLEILAQFKPEDFSTNNVKIEKLNTDLDQMDFQKLSRNLEYSLHGLDNIAKQQNASRSIIDNLDPIVKKTLDRLNISADAYQRPAGTKNDGTRNMTRRQYAALGRVRRKPFMRRMRDNNDSLDALCAIIFCNSSTTARVLFDLLVEVARNDPTYKFIKPQFLSDPVADPALEPKEAEFEHRRQEEVLKRFRMHDCNVLVGTSVLEEGIDVPKTNLVIRWDTPSTYRSYVQCKGKARATPAHHIILVAPKFDTTASNSYTEEQLSESSHRFLCQLRGHDTDAISDSSEPENDGTHHVIIGSAIGTVKILNPEVITSKPPTSCELILHEINDDLQAIEATIDPVAIPSLTGTPQMIQCNGLDKISNTSSIISSNSNKMDDKTSQYILDGNISDCYEVCNLSDALAKEKERANGFNMNSSKEVIPLENTPSIQTNHVQPPIELVQTPIELVATSIELVPTPIELVLPILVDEKEFALNYHTTLRGTKGDALPIGDVQLARARRSVSQSSDISEQNASFSQNLKPRTRTSTPSSRSSESSIFVSSEECSTDNLSERTSVNDRSVKNQFSRPSSPPQSRKGSKKRRMRRSGGKKRASHSCVCCARVEDTMDDEGLSSSFVIKLVEMEEQTDLIVEQLANYRQIEKMLLQHCANTEPSEIEHHLADEFTGCVEPYKPLATLLTAQSVDLSTSIALVNKYCSKLPSDTFTKLTALWRCAQSVRNNVRMYQYTIRLPINSPLKYDIVGVPMPTMILARRMAALQACIQLHESGELDHNLQPIGKEGFRAIESDWENFELEEQDEKIVIENIEPRPGTTKRRQYYYKRIASEFCKCRPTSNTPCYLYLLDLTLQCPIPEEQNTRGRKIYPPEDAQQGFGILTLKKIPKLSSFPIFTRSGEVKVSIELAKERIVLTEEQIYFINTFLNYTFTNVLRLQKFLMLFDPDSTENCVFIVPTIKTELGRVIDWEFLKLIEQNASMMPTAVAESVRQSTEFDANKFKDAVVMPWYRNQDQPQYFYVAEICPHLSPLSCFPGENYHTFKHYYFLKYNLQIQNSKQPLLDVDHTSARLNFLTPRYVNRKGVALPTSSEETKRAKRENLEQKQILVPELCTVHPFPASLWRTAVCLPCILYRINGLLLADDIRKKVSFDIGLGQQEISDDFEWPMLDFGWSLSEVLKKSRENKAKTLESTTNDTVNATPTAPTNAKSKKTDNQQENKEVDNPVVDSKVEKSANEIVLEGEKKLQGKNYIEIGTWSNDMANDISSVDEDEDEFLKCLPSNVSFCNQNIDCGSPNRWKTKDADWGGATIDATNSLQPPFRRNSIAYYDSDDSLASNYEPIHEQYSSDEWDEDTGMLRIAFTSRNEAETIETEQDIEKHKKQLSIIHATNANETDYQKTKNLQVGYNFVDLLDEMESALATSRAGFSESTTRLKVEIESSGMMVRFNEPFTLPKKEDATKAVSYIRSNPDALYKMLPYVDRNVIELQLHMDSASLTVKGIEELNRLYVATHPQERFTIVGTGDVFDNFNDKNELSTLHDKDVYWKDVKLSFDKHNTLAEPVRGSSATKFVNSTKTNEFSFDYQPNLTGHPGPSPSIILQALTMSNANDGINLERLETIGDSFLKYAITTYLYITYENVHEGKLSHLRSKQVANLNLYRLGRRKVLGEYMIATKFEPHDNWLPPCYYVPKELEKALIEAKIPPHHWKLVDLPNIKKLSSTEICELVRQKADQLGLINEDYIDGEDNGHGDELGDATDFTCFIPYNLVTQHSIPDKSVADCVEALIGAYLIECGSRGALLFMAWLGIRVLPFERKPYNPNVARIPGSTRPDKDNMITVYGDWTPPKSPLLHFLPNAEKELESMLDGFDEFEATLGYKFRDRSYLLQAMTHASYSPNRLTDCYQRLEFLGDAVLDYLITRHLYEDPRQHSPGALTDLRSALVNNTIFASLAVRHGFHKYFRHLSPGLNDVIDRFVRIQNENGHVISEEYYLLSEEECDDAEDVEVPKALGDVFESVAGAIFLDSYMSLDVVWKVYSNMMNPEIEQFSNSVPKSPIRELLELEPETAKFGKPEKLADGRRVRVSVEVFSKGIFRGIGRNYRIAKCTAAKCALRQLKKQGLISKKD